MAGAAGEKRKEKFVLNIYGPGGILVHRAEFLHKEEKFNPLVEERVTQALETLRTFGWSFHKKIEGSSRWAKRLGGAQSANKGGEPDWARLSRTSETGRAGCSRVAMWPVPCCGPQPQTRGAGQQFVVGR